MTERHSLTLKIDAAANLGTADFKGANDGVRCAVRDLEKDSAGDGLSNAQRPLRRNA